MTVESYPEPQYPPEFLVDRTVPGEALEEIRRQAARLPALQLTLRNASDLLLLATGGFTPLAGFMTYDEARWVVEELRLPDQTLWPLPVLLQTSRDQTRRLRRGKHVALRFGEHLLGRLDVAEWFQVPLREWSEKIYRTTDEAHPGVAAFFQGGEVAIAGRVEWFGDPKILGLDELWRTPAQTREEIRRRGWKTVAGFQTRNPIHRAHEYVLRTALEVTDGLLLHPLVGQTREEDVPAAVRLECYRVLLDQYLPKERVIFSVHPAWMRYAGPREAAFHAVVRRNFGCTHFLVGRDHAGVGKFYSPYEAHELLRELAQKGLGIQPLFFDEVFYCHRCQSMASRKTCAHPPQDHLALSGTEVRRRLREGLSLPPEFSRPEVAAVLAEAFRPDAGGAHD